MIFIKICYKSKETLNKCIFPASDREDTPDCSNIKVFHTQKENAH